MFSWLCRVISFSFHGYDYGLIQNRFLKFFNDRSGSLHFFTAPHTEDSFCKNHDDIEKLLSRSAHLYATTMPGCKCAAPRRKNIRTQNRISRSRGFFEDRSAGSTNTIPVIAHIRVGGVPRFYMRPPAVREVDSNASEL